MDSTLKACNHAGARQPRIEVSARAGAAGSSSQIAWTRRAWIKTAAGAAAIGAAPLRAVPSAPVAVARCRAYARTELLPVMERMFDQLGGLGRLVAGKTVAMKINLTGSPRVRLAHEPAELAQWTHSAVIGTAVELLGRAGARRIRLLESAWNTAEPLEEYMMEANWSPQDLLNAASRVEMENTNWLGAGRKYSRFAPPKNGYMYPAFDLNHSYEDCDVFVSIAKMKDHATAGITLSMKNLFGIAPATIYGDGAGADEPSVLPRGGRGMFHSGHRQPARSSPGEHPDSPRDPGARVPRIVADLAAARPIHLAIIDGVETMAGGEGPWVAGCRHLTPGLLVAGTNAVNTDAVAAALMGYDPMADRGVAPFERCDSTLRLGQEHGIGTRDLRHIEVVGERNWRELVYPFRRKS